jgi:hypothetical protein
MAKTRTTKLVKELQKMRDGYPGKPGTVRQILTEVKRHAALGFSEVSWVVDPDFVWGAKGQELKKLGLKVSDHAGYPHTSYRTAYVSWL